MPRNCLVMRTKHVRAITQYGQLAVELALLVLDLLRLLNLVR